MWFELQDQRYASSTRVTTRTPGRTPRSRLKNKILQRGLWIDESVKSWNMVKRVATPHGKVTFRPFLMGDVFFQGYKRAFYARKLVIAPQRGNRAGFSRNEFWLLAERYPGHFPAYRLSQLREFRTSSFFNFLTRKKKVITQEPPFWSTSSFPTAQLKNEPSPKSSQLRLSRSGKLIWVPLRA